MINRGTGGTTRHCLLFLDHVFCHKENGIAYQVPGVGMKQEELVCVVLLREVAVHLVTEMTGRLASHSSSGTGHLVEGVQRTCT